MKLSNETKEVLKNYSSINANLLVAAGDTISTMSQMKNIVSTSKLPDTFETDFAIYDLNEFLSALSLFKDPDLNFGEKSVKISEGSQGIEYFYSDPSVVTTPKTSITMPDVDAEFVLTQSVFNQVMKASAVLGAPDMVLYCDGEKYFISVTDRKNTTSNSFKVEVGESEESHSLVECYFKVENLKLLSGDYKVEVSSAGISKFTNVNRDTEYFIALETA
jgi:hypothetical protein